MLEPLPADLKVVYNSWVHHKTLLVCVIAVHHVNEKYRS